MINRRWRFTWRYLRGNTPWDSGIVPPEIVAWVEAGDHPAGRALDLGCGTGTTSIYLARQGWQVIGIDFAPNAIQKARRKARQAGVADSVSFHSADVSRLDFLHGAFDLAVDVGCLHGLDADQRQRYAAHLARLARPGATYLLYAFVGGVRRGIDPEEAAALFAPAFERIDYVLGEEVTTPVPSAWYTFQRNDTPS